MDYHPNYQWSGREGVTHSAAYISPILMPPRSRATRRKRVWESVKDTANGGEKNFLDIDADKQYYDFRLDSLSRAVNAGTVLPHGYSDYDRLGLRRDDKPDIGAYEYQEP